MEAQQFCYWLQGFAELSGDAMPTQEQWDSIREHLAAVFHKVTPPVKAPAKTNLPDLSDFFKQAEKQQDKSHWPASPSYVPNPFNPLTGVATC